MSVILTKTGIEFDDFRVSRTATFDAETGENVIRWYISVGYRVTTQEGEVIVREEHREITGAIKTKTKSLLSDVRAFILQQEGL